MATKPKANPMRKPKTPSTRTPITRGQDRKTMREALVNTNLKSMAKRFDDTGEMADSRKTYKWSEMAGRANAEQKRWSKTEKLRKEEKRIKEAGARMGRMQTAAKAKRGK
jgi:hypothetical protein